MASRCRSCRARIHGAARTCPHCGRRVARGRGRGWLALALLVPAALAAAALSGWWRP